MYDFPLFLNEHVCRFEMVTDQQRRQLYRTLNEMKNCIYI